MTAVPDRVSREANSLIKDRRLRVCHLGKFYPPATGGIENHLQLLAKGQSDLGLQVRVLCVNHRDHAGNDITWNTFARSATSMEEEDGIEVVRLGKLASVARFDVIPGIHSWLKKIGRETDLFHLHTPNPTMLMGVATYCKKIPLVITHHSDVIKQKLLRYPLIPFEHSVYRQARQIYATSPRYQAGSQLLAKYREKVSVLPLGIDLERFVHPSAEALNFRDEINQKYSHPIWLSVGRLNYYKGLDVGIRALKNVPGTWIIAGTGPLQKEWQTLAEREGVSERIVWAGRVSDEFLVGAYHAATAFWFPSNARSEGFGLVQVEAMASGCPVINTSIPNSGVDWVSQHEETGLTVPINDAKAFAEAANRIASQKQKREQLSSGSRSRSLEFDRSTMVEKSVELYCSAIDHPFGWKAGTSC